MTKTSIRKSNMDPSETPVVILCGGQGTRLREETEYIPKPMVKIGEHPVIWHVMKIYYEQGFRKFVLLTGYKGEQVKEYFYYYPIHRSNFTLRTHKDGQEIIYHSRPKEEWEITILDTGLTAETGARLKQAEWLLKDTAFMMTYTDGVADICLPDLLRIHRAQKKTATMTVVCPPGRFGEVMIDGGLARSFREKPSNPASPINAGFFAIEPSIFKHLSENQELNFEKDVLPKLAQKSELAVSWHDGYWQCMDTLKDFMLLNEEWKKEKPPWKIW